MRLFPGNPYGESALWMCMAVSAILLFFFAATNLILLLIQKRYKWLWLAGPVLCLSYFLEQCFDMAITDSARTRSVRLVVARFAALPDWLLLLFCLALAVVLCLIFQNIRRYEKRQITRSSVKEAMDTLPDGILCYAPGARVLLVNRAMEDFCRKTTGTELEDGTVFRERLMEGKLLPSCERVFVGGEPVIVLQGGEAWKLQESEIPYEKHTVRMLLALNITEAYRKTQELTQMQEKLERLGTRLLKVNREIVAMTAEREVLNAKVMMHDELGSNLLALKRYLVSGGTEKEKAKLMEGLISGVSFLKNDSSAAPVQDEYELLHSVAEQLGLKLSVTGELPQTEHHKPVIATAIHECMTNTLRHAHGDELHVELFEDEAWVTAVITNNGDQPATEISEKGGLRSLREMTEQAGGSMTVRIKPAFTITIQLPKEDVYGL